MLRIVAVMLSGIAAGVLLRRRPMRFLSKLIMVLVWALLFLIGVEVGSDPRVIRRLHDLGLEALILTVGGLTGSMLAAWLLWRSVSNKRSCDEE